MASDLLKRFWLFSFVLLVFLCGFYIFQVNSIASDLSFVEKEGKKLKELETENENLQVEFTRVTSLENLENKVSELNFEKVTEISYLKALETWVAIK